ncbi:hypothetical protein FRC01_001244 [Tulasnella sp. 417]|nr:hypothetical protein FRC01_001244 [Tulasnella sp. 417]
MLQSASPRIVGTLSQVIYASHSSGLKSAALSRGAGEEANSEYGDLRRKRSRPVLADNFTPPIGQTGNETDPDQESKLLRYRGYLGIDVKVLNSDLATLRKGSNVSAHMVDFLLHRSHTVAHEAFQWRSTEVLVFPCAFTRGLLAIDEQGSPVNVEHHLQRLHSQVTTLSLAQIWASSLILLPAQFGGQYVLLAVTNACLAISRSDPARSIHDVLPGHSKPDREPFAILFLSSTSVLEARSLERIKYLIVQYLQLLWKWECGADLEFVDWVDVECPVQDVIEEGGLHVVHHAEVLMKPGVADRLRQAYQRKSTLYTPSSSLGFRTSTAVKMSSESNPNPPTEETVAHPPAIDREPPAHGSSLPQPSHKSKRKGRHKSHSRSSSSDEKSDSSSSTSGISAEKLQRVKKQQKKLKRQLELLSTLLAKTEGALEGDGSISDSTDEDTRKKRKKTKHVKESDVPSSRPLTNQNTGTLTSDPTSSAIGPHESREEHVRSLPKPPTHTAGESGQVTNHHFAPESGDPAPGARTISTSLHIPNPTQQHQTATSASRADPNHESRPLRTPSDTLPSNATPRVEPTTTTHPAVRINDDVDLPELPPVQPEPTFQQQRPALSSLPINEDLLFNEADLPEEDLESYGTPVSVPPADGCFASVHYPDRDTPLRMPTGTITKQAYSFRYQGLSDEARASKIWAIQQRSEACPATFQNVLKSSAKGNFDAQFPDLHPDYIKVRDAEMEKLYLDKTCNTISAAYHQLRSKLKLTGKVESMDKMIIKWLSEPSQPPRPHDLWARSQLNRSDATDSPGPSPVLTQFAKDWQVKKAASLEQLGPEEWEAKRLAIEQEFRKKAFENLVEAERNIWIRQAKAEEKPVDKMTALIRGLPFVTHVVKRFADLAEVPMAILLGAPDPTQPGGLAVYHDTFVGPAPAHVEDFWSGPNQLGTRQIIPEWRRYVADVFQKSQDAIRAEPQTFPDFSGPETASERLPSAATTRVVDLNGIRFIVTPPPLNWCLRTPEREEIIKNLRVAFAESWSKYPAASDFILHTDESSLLSLLYVLPEEAFGRGRVDFAVMRNRTSEFALFEHLPLSQKKMGVGPDGLLTLVDAQEETRCLPGDPKAMDPQVLEAWYNMFTDDSIPEESRFRWTDGKRAPAPQGEQIPGSIEANALNATRRKPKTSKSDTEDLETES